MDKTKTRKPHKKSRNGCFGCKARHIKCDEQIPDCLNCVTQGTKCEYRPKVRREAPNLSPPLVPLQNFTPASSEGTVFEQTVSSNGAHAKPDVMLNIPQLRLFHHYTTVTTKTLATNLDAENIFTTTLVQTAFEYPYLLYSLLALTALHVNHIENQSRTGNLDLVIQAGQYHDAALSDFQSTVSDIDDTNFKSVLMFAGTLFPYSCALSTAANSDLDNAFENVLSNIVLTRRLRPMVSRVFDAMKNSDLGKLIPEDVKNIQWDTEELPKETQLVELRKFSNIARHVYPSDIFDAYEQAIHTLELIFARVAESSLPPSDSLLKIWIHFISDRYVELLSKKQPGSLIIFSHYAVLLRRAEHYWYLEGLAEQILHIADALVPTEWSKWLDWPKEQILGNAFRPV